MGNSKHTPEEDYRHYARPEPGSGESWVEVVDDGSGRRIEAAQPPGTSLDSDENPDSVRANGEVFAQSPSDPPAVHRRNLSLWAAWALVALMLAVGMAWLFGFTASPWDESGIPETQSEVLRLNLYTLGPSLTAAGLLGTVILLAVQAAVFRRSPRAE
ncbi:hypothetical protein OL239_16450 [Arthrobacter sp. ATA002]|uniref:hypothetical protein n=1 Tax=Arthrobacter sp. ATA002 TaxID=2991715 RepID=UPI0022A7CA50|nr:hypothetical protein [Arthrobacter sp. ATA002]WAP51393.1 hypothetical protein OL239_16450 [Arthrobacter sp. ATA002]